MLSEPQREYLKLVLRPMQIIVGALAAGVFTFMAMMPLIASDRGVAGQPERQLFAYLGVGFAALAILAWAVAQGLIASRMRQAIVDGKPMTNRRMFPGAADAGDVEPLAAMYQTRLIIGGALLEGAAFFNLVAYMLEGQPISLAVAAVLALILLSQIPTLGRLQSWVESELSTIKQLRAMGSKHGR